LIEASPVGTAALSRFSASGDTRAAAAGDWPYGGRRTTGLLLSNGRGGREMAEPVGERRNSRPRSGAMDDRRLRAMLGE